MSKSKTALVAGSSGVSLAELASAGITEFKLTKEDIVDLLVSEAAASVEAEIAAYDVETAVLEAAEKAKHEATLKEVLAWYQAHPAGQALQAAFPGRDFEIYGTTQFALLNKPLSSGYPTTIEASLTLTLPAELNSAALEAMGCLRTSDSRAVWIRSDGRAKLSYKLSQVERSTKKLKTQLVRKILSGSETGANVLSNVKGLSADFLAALTASDGHRNY